MNLFNPAFGHLKIIVDPFLEGHLIWPKKLPKKYKKRYMKRYSSNRKNYTKGPAFMVRGNIKCSFKAASPNPPKELKIIF